MSLFIRIVDGAAFEHPILEDNFRQVFPDIDTDNLPSNFARFERVSQPAVGVYELYEGVTYEWSGEIMTDVHHVRDMTIEEKTEKQNKVKAEWAQFGFASWIFDEVNCVFNPPTERPDDDKPYKWDEATVSWVEVV